MEAGGSKYQEAVLSAATEEGKWVETMKGRLTVITPYDV
jgi:hypothetical protein